MKKTKWTLTESEGLPCLTTKWATVWFNGVWHTWDKHGVGGYNAREDTVDEALRQAYLAAKDQGFIKE